MPRNNYINHYNHNNVHELTKSSANIYCHLEPLPSTSM